MKPGGQCRLALEEMYAAVDGRIELVDATLDSWDVDQALRRPVQALKSISEAAGMPIQLSKAGLQALKDDPRVAATEVLDQIEAALLQSAAAHVSVVLERLLGRRPAPDPAEHPLTDPQVLPIAPGRRAGCFRCSQEIDFSVPRATWLASWKPPCRNWRVRWVRGAVWRCWKS